MCAIFTHCAHSMRITDQGGVYAHCQANSTFTPLSCLPHLSAQVSEEAPSSTPGKWVQPSPQDSSHTARPSYHQMQTVVTPPQPHHQHLPSLQPLPLLLLLLVLPVLVLEAQLLEVSCSLSGAPPCAEVRSYKPPAKSALQHLQHLHLSSSSMLCRRLCSSLCSSGVWTR